jgi:hypothetical protein
MIPHSQSGPTRWVFEDGQMVALDDPEPPQIFPDMFTIAEEQTPTRNGQPNVLGYGMWG